MAEPLTTGDGRADAVIDQLRESAKAVKELGDANVRLRDENDRLLNDLGTAQEQEEGAAHALGVWRDLLEDFRLGVRDADELIERTVGKK